MPIMDSYATEKASSEYKADNLAISEHCVLHTMFDIMF